jgi:hypothetical protein
MPCEQCKNLDHASTDTAPHAALVELSRIERADGDLLTYRCTVCHSLWLRFETNNDFAGADQHWERISDV